MAHATTRAATSRIPPKALTKGAITDIRKSRSAADAESVRIRLESVSGCYRNRCPDVPECALTALQTAELSGLNRNTVNRHYGALRKRIHTACEAQRPFFGVVEADESWFGARRVKGKRGRGADGKTTVFGIFERAGKVYTEIVPDCSKATLQGIIRGRVDPSSFINTDGWRGYNGLVDLGYGHIRVDHGQDEFVRRNVHINGIEGFWGMAKVRLAKFKGLPKHTFHLHLKETEWRYNHRHDNRYRILLRYLREEPIS